MKGKFVHDQVEQRVPPSWIIWIRNPTDPERLERSVTKYLGCNNMGSGVSTNAKPTRMMTVEVTIDKEECWDWRIERNES